MKIANINRVEELIDKYKAYNQFYEYQQTALNEALESGQTDPPYLHLQLIGPRTMSKQISIRYGSNLYFDIMECVEGELNRIEDELSDL